MLSGIFLLIPIILIGYFFNKYNPHLRYRFSKLSGHHLYFTAAGFGFGLIIISCIIFFVLTNITWLIQCGFSKKIICVFDLYGSVNLIFSSSNKIINFVFIFLLSIIMAYLFSIFNIKRLKKISKNKDLYDPIIFNSISKDPIDHLINDASFQKELNEENENLIMLTMKDRKVYIGIVYEIRSQLFERFSLGSNDFKFLPFLSGYRDKDNLNVVITTDYSASIQDKVYLTSILNRNEILSGTKIYIDQLNKFLSDENILHKQIINSHKNNERVLILLKNNFFYLGNFSQSSVINKRVLKDFGVVKFDICNMGKMISKNINFEVNTTQISECGRGLSSLVSNDTIIRLDEISMLHTGSNIESIFYSLIENNNFIEIEREKVWSDFSKLDKRSS